MVCPKGNLLHENTGVETHGFRRGRKRLNLHPITDNNWLAQSALISYNLLKHGLSYRQVTLNQNNLIDDGQK